MVLYKIDRGKEQQIFLKKKHERKYLKKLELIISFLLHAKCVETVIERFFYKYKFT